MKETYIIQDWAGNILNFRGNFEDNIFAVAMEFESFEDAWDYVYNRYRDLEESDFDDAMSQIEVRRKSL